MALRIARRGAELLLYGPPRRIGVYARLGQVPPQGIGLGAHEAQGTRVVVKRTRAEPE